MPKILVKRDEPKPKSKIHARIVQLFTHAERKGKQKYEQDIAHARAQEHKASTTQKERHGPLETQEKRDDVYQENYRRAAVNAKPTHDVEARKASGMYSGSVPVAGATTKKIYRKNHPVKGIKNSDAPRHVKKAMIKRLKR